VWWQNREERREGGYGEYDDVLFFRFILLRAKSILFCVGSSLPPSLPPHLLMLPLLLQASTNHVGRLLGMQLVEVVVGQRPLVAGLRERGREGGRDGTSRGL